LVYNILRECNLLKEYKRNTNIGVGLGWVVIALANFPLRTGSFGGPIVGYLLYATGVVLFLWGCSQYARGKGYSPYWGALGLLYILGLLVLVFMPDRHKDAT
jgi:hypothetical protein